MSPSGRPAEAEQPEFDEARRLIRARDGYGLSLREWLSRRVDRFALRLPLGVPGRGTIKLAAVPKDPVAGDRVLGEQLLAGRLAYGGDLIDLDRVDLARGGFSPAAFDYLHSFIWLRDLAAAATREKGGRLAEKLVQQWLEGCATTSEHPSWRPDLWGLRVLFWTAYAPYILSTRDPVYRSSLLMALVRGARYLDREADRTPAGIQRITAWSGVVASAMLLDGGVVRLGRAEGGLLRAVGEALYDDGGLVSRSPLEQLKLVELLGQLRAVYNAGRRHLPDRLHEALGGSVAALLAVSLGDEALSSWQGGNMASRRRVVAAIEGAGVAARPLRRSRGWGYQRLSAKAAALVFDGAPPPPSRILAGSCASTLGFEFSDGPTRLVVNCGGAGQWTGSLPSELEHALRFTAAHSTLTLGDRNSTAIIDGGLLGKGVRQVELMREESGGTAVIEATHDGYARRFGLFHKRRLVLASDGRELRGEDRMVPAKRGARGEPLGYAIRFHLGADVEPTATADGRGALLRVRGGKPWQFRCESGSLSIEESLWIDGDGRPHAAAQLVISGQTNAEGAAVAWLFQRAA